MAWGFSVPCRSLIRTDVSESSAVIRRERSKAATPRQPNTRESKVGLRGEDVVVVVVVQHSDAVPIPQRGDDEIDGRKAMVPVGTRSV